MSLINANSYGTSTGTAGAAVNGATVIRDGTVMVGNNAALGGSTIELGDTTRVLTNVAYATTGASVLGFEHTYDFSTDNRSAHGGVFLENGDGILTSGNPGSGPGAFFNVNATLAGHTFTSADIGVRILVKDEVDNPERNGIYQVSQINADGTMNLVRATDFDTAAEMSYGSQVTVTGGGTYFMASPNITNVNGTGSDPVHWLADTSNPNVTLQVANGTVTTVSQAIDVNANGTGTTSIVSATPVTFSGAVTLQDLKSGVQESKTLTLNSTATSGSGMEFTGVISEAANGGGPTDDVLALLKTGTGIATLTQNNTYHGGTTVSGGTLLVTNTTGSGTGSGDVVVQSGGALGGTGIIAPAVGSDITVNSGADLLVGTPGGTSPQTLTIALQSTGVTAPTQSVFTLAGTLKLDLFQNQAATPVTESDRLVFTNTGSSVISLSPGAVLNVGIGAGSPLDPSTFNVGDTWKLIDWAGLTPSGTFTFSNLNGNYTSDFVNLPDLSSSGYFWDISQLYTAGTIIVAVPEPGRLALLILGVLALGWRRRRGCW